MYIYKVFTLIFSAIRRAEQSKTQKYTNNSKHRMYFRPFQKIEESQEQRKLKKFEFSSFFLHCVGLSITNLPEGHTQFSLGQPKWTIKKTKNKYLVTITLFFDTNCKFLWYFTDSMSSVLGYSPVCPPCDNEMKTDVILEHMCASEFGKNTNT